MIMRYLDPSGHVFSWICAFVSARMLGRLPLLRPTSGSLLTKTCFCQPSANRCFHTLPPSYCAHLTYFLCCKTAAADLQMSELIHIEDSSNIMDMNGSWDKRPSIRNPKPYKPYKPSCTTGPGRGPYEDYASGPPLGFLLIFK